MTYSVDFRREVLSVRAQEGLSMKEVAQRFDVGDASVMCWVKEVVPRTTWNKPAIKIDMEALARDGAEHPDHYYYERAAPFSVSSTCICKALKRLGVTYKKSLQHPKAHPEVRTAFQEKLRKYQNEGRPVVCIDESGFAQDMPRKHGHAKQGKRYFSRYAWGERGRINVIGALLGATLLTVRMVLWVQAPFSAQ